MKEGAAGRQIVGKGCREGGREGGREGTSVRNRWCILISFMASLLL